MQSSATFSANHMKNANHICNVSHHSRTVLRRIESDEIITVLKMLDQMGDTPQQSKQRMKDDMFHLERKRDMNNRSSGSRKKRRGRAALIRLP